MTLRVVGSNTAARRLYSGCGFVEQGVLRDEFLLDGRLVDDILKSRTCGLRASGLSRQTSSGTCRWASTRSNSCTAWTVALISLTVRSRRALERSLAASRAARLS